MGRVAETEYTLVSGVSANLALYECTLGEKSLAAFAIVRGRYQESS